MLADASQQAHNLALYDSSEFNALSRLVGWDTEYMQLSGGPLRGSLASGVCDTLRIGNPAFNQSMICRGNSPPDCVALLLPEANHAVSIFQGRDFSYGQAAIMCPGSEATFRMPARFGFTTVSIPLSRLRGLVESTSERPLDPLTDSTRILPLGSAAVAQLILLMRQALVCMQAETAVRPGSIVFQEIEQHIVSAMALALTVDSDKTSGKISRRVQVFMRAHDYIEANLAGPLGLEILALQANVSLRTLRYSFAQVAGISPLRFIKTRRLIAARRLLLAAHPGETRVTDIALRCGFSHMSYFARDYRALFGQMPSQTLGSRYARTGKYRDQESIGPRSCCMQFS